MNDMTRRLEGAHTRAANSATATPQIRVVHLASPADVPVDAIGAIVYGRGAAAECALIGDPRFVGVEMPVLQGASRVEAWISAGPQRSGELCGVRYVATDSHFFGVVEVDEAEWGGLLGAAREAYARVLRAQGALEYSVWRMWNYLDAINAGSGDGERYRQFCLGRAEVLGASMKSFPAASALGRIDGVRRLQVIWVAGREEPVRIENPRQVSAFRYPRRYGPRPPSFARGARIGTQLVISGTASILGHETVHAGDVRRQTAETISNLREVARAAGVAPDELACLKVYLRKPDDVSALVEALGLVGMRVDGCCLLQADICRNDLLVEIEAVAGC
jgi:chorismate lyase/3-hydroxybenzoate synthase